MSDNVHNNGQGNHLIGHPPGMPTELNLYFGLDPNETDRDQALGELFIPV